MYTFSAEIVTFVIWVMTNDKTIKSIKSYNSKITSDLAILLSDLPVFPISGISVFRVDAELLAQVAHLQLCRSTVQRFSLSH